MKWPISPLKLRYILLQQYVFKGELLCGQHHQQLKCVMALKSLCT
jgi:hypothetical protein